MDSEISPQGYSSPLATYEPQIPNERKLAEQKERDETLAQLPLLGTVLKRLDNEIAKLNNRKHCRNQRLTKYSELTAEQFDVVADITADILTKERSFIDNRIVRASKKG